MLKYLNVLKIYLNYLQSNKMSNEQTVASIIMTSGGSTFGIVGTLLSSLSSLYIIKNISTTGCSAVEYLPKLLDFSGSGEKPIETPAESRQHTAVSTTAIGKANAILKRFGVDLRTYMWLGVFLVAGVGSKKLGTFISSPDSIAIVEKMLYRKA